MRTTKIVRRRLAVAIFIAALSTLFSAGTAQAGVAPEISDTLVLKNAGEVTNVRFAPNGEVFAIDKEGQIFDFPSLAEPNNEVTVADLSAKVMDYEDRGMLGLAIDPQYPVKPYIYVLYAYNAPPGKEEEAPVWPQKTCPMILVEGPGQGPEFPEGGDGCVITGRLSRITVDLATHKMLGEEKPLITDWCQQYSSHSIGDLQFGPEGDLYASGGTGGAFNVADWGQYGGTEPNKEHPIVPANPCGDPNETSGTGAGVPGATKEELPTAEGGVLRSQSFRRPENQPASLDGTIARVDPETGEPLASNPNIGKADENRQRIVAYGLRQPFRFTFRPGTSEIWEGDVGENKWEEINRDAEPLVAPSKNYGWPCFEGGEKGESDLPYEYGTEYEGDNLCKSLYKGGGPEAETEIAPYYAYNHGALLKTGEECPYRSGIEASETGSSISGLAFIHGGPWPAAWDGALLFGDVTRDCIWAMFPETAGGLPKPEESSIKTIESLSANKGVVCEIEPVTEGCPVDLELGPEGDIYYADINSGTVRRLSYKGYPVAVIGVGAPTTHAEFPVVFTGDKSISAGPGSISYHWDFGDGASSSSADPSHTYMLAGTYTATLAVTYGEAPHTEDQSSVKVTVLPETAQEEKERQEEKEHLEEEERQEAKERKEAKERQEAKERAEATERQRAKEHQEAKEREEKERVLVESTILSGVSLAPIRFRVARAAVLRKASGKGKSAVGATLRFNLSQGGSVTSTFSRKVHAVKGFIYKSVASRGVVSVCTGSARAHTRKCRAPSSNRIAVTAVKGANTQVLSGWVGGVALPPGAYSVTVQAVGVDMTVSAPVVVHFVVLASAKG